MITEYWDFNQDWLNYVKSSWQRIGRVELVNDDSKERIAFRERARLAFISQGIPVSFVKTYLSVQEPEEGEGYASQYPHIHYPLDATTLIHYLQPGDVPAPLDVFDGTEEPGDVVETIYPEPGLTVFMPHTTWHGARKNNGTTNRIQLIATALK